MRSWRVPAAWLALLTVCVVVFWRVELRTRLDRPIVLAQVKQLNQLATVSYTIQKVVAIREEKQPVGSESILLILQAKVEAGINLDGMRAEDITIRRDGGITVRLPPPKILNVYVDEKNTKVWDRQKTWWTPWVPYSLDLEQRARIAGLEAVRQAALDMGILANAEYNAENSVRVLLELAGAKQVVVLPAASS
jgi:hypothetical protein